MATNGKASQPVTFRRPLLEVQFAIYRRIVERKHGLPCPYQPKTLQTWPTRNCSRMLIPFVT